MAHRAHPAAATVLLLRGSPDIFFAWSLRALVTEAVPLIKAIEESVGDGEPDH